MTWDWYGKMKLLAGVGKYQPTWTSPCTGGATVDGKMEAAANGKFRPLPDAFGKCSSEDLSALDRYMAVVDGKLKPHVKLTTEKMCCPGGNCSACDDILWNIDETPYEVKMTITGIYECAAACSGGYWDLTSEGTGDNNNEWVLTQHSQSDYYCSWWYTDYVSSPNRFILWWASYYYPPASWLQIWTNDYGSPEDINYYFKSQGIFCGTTFSGYFLSGCCDGEAFMGLPGYPPGEQVAYGGSATISWPI